MELKLDIGQSPSGIPYAIDLTGRENANTFICGISGAGKTTLLRRLTAQVPAQGGHVVIFDVGRDYFPPTVGGENVGSLVSNFHRLDVRSPALVFNPLLPQTLPSGALESPSHIAERVAGTLRRVYRLRDSQEIALINAITTFICSDAQPYSLWGLVTFLSADPALAKTVKTSIGRLVHLSNVVNFGVAQTPFSFGQPGTTVLDFADVISEDAQALVAEILLSEILAARMNTAAIPSVPLVLVFDEAQRFRFGKGSSLDRLLREGRKFNVAGWFSTQFLTDQDAIASLGNAAFRVQFRPVGHQVRQTAREMAWGDRKMEERLLAELPTLQRGQFLFRDRHGRLRKIVR